MGPEDPRPGADWDAFRAARERFFSTARPEAMEDPPPSICPDGVPGEWTAAHGEGDPDVAGG
jgi:hypothetical protein